MQNILINSYLIGTPLSLALALAAGKKKGIRGITLLFGAVMLAASWPLWAAGAIILGAIGTVLAVVGTVALCVFLMFCVTAFIWITLLLKCMEILGWFRDSSSRT